MPVIVATIQAQLLIIPVMKRTILALVTMATKLNTTSKPTAKIIMLPPTSTKLSRLDTTKATTRPTKKRTDQFTIRPLTNMNPCRRAFLTKPF